MVNLVRETSDPTKRALLTQHFFEENPKAAFNKTNRCIIDQKQGAVVTQSFRDIFVAVNQMKGFDYIQIYYYKWINSYGKTISEYNVKRGGQSKRTNFGCFFICSIECVE